MSLIIKWLFQYYRCIKPHYVCISINLIKRRSHLAPSSSAATLPLTIVENRSHGKAEIVNFSKLTSVEILTPPWCIDCLSTKLSEQYQHDTMNSRCWPWILVTHNLIA